MITKPRYLELWCAKCARPRRRRIRREVRISRLGYVSNVESCNRCGLWLAPVTSDGGGEALSAAYRLAGWKGVQDLVLSELGEWNTLYVQFDRKRRTRPRQRYRVDRATTIRVSSSLFPPASPNVRCVIDDPDIPMFASLSKAVDELPWDAVLGSDDETP